MPDWNNDGKIDWHDDFEFDHFINTDSPCSPPPSSSYCRSSIFMALGLLMKILGAVFIAIFGFVCFWLMLWLASKIHDIFL